MGKNKKSAKKLLIIDSDAEQSLKLSHQVEFIDYEPKVLSSHTLLDSMSDLAEYAAIFIANFHGIVDWAGELATKNEKCPPLVLLLGNQPADLSQKEIEATFVGCLKSTHKYAELSDILHRAEVRGTAATQPVKESSSNPELFRSLVGNRTGVTSPLSRSTAELSRPNCLKVSCLVMRRVLSPALLVPGRGASSWLKAARFFWMKLAICPLTCK